MSLLAIIPIYLILAICYGVADYKSTYYDDRNVAISSLLGALFPVPFTYEVVKFILTKIVRFFQFFIRYR